MYKQLVLTSIFIGIFLSQVAAQEIKLIGSTANIMKEKNLSANLSLDSLKGRKHMYAIGAVENLQGEVLIIDGKPIVAELDDNRQPIWTSTWNRDLIFLVSAEVSQWRKIKLDQPISNRMELEKVIFDYAQKEGLDLVNGFPFRVKVKARKIQAHIAYLRPESILEFSPQVKKQDDYPLKLIEESVFIIGFAGETAGGRFAMPGMPGREASNMHMHYVKPGLKEAGHIEDLEFEGVWQLCLPLK
ncbi:acetolactate decarboxylase [Algoriphagus hitonicola]|uniref:Acetolactate decarboxylase n=1 Tax=Algoriphagus hitonicola TaxID=435880 RepID=A0A1I2VWD7_9BACT|nr:acetolactate decarboxylase [Algoriphagus hitonicola]SFG93548.1 acetolactate decarboxylase [Algoriphagus hitonicola]